MKKIIALIIPIFVLFGMLIGVSQLEKQRVTDWQVEITNYIAWRKSQNETVQIQTIIVASRPWNFEASMGEPILNDWPWGVQQLPYPPTALKCVILDEINISASEEVAETTQQVIYIGYFDDSMWRAGWLVHEAPLTSELFYNLATIGCELNLERWDLAVNRLILSQK